jgi:hypothetical protein
MHRWNYPTWLLWLTAWEAVHAPEAKGEITMNTLTRTLLGGGALAALATAPAHAGNAPVFHIQALHGGKAVNKTKMNNQKAGHVTYTLSVYTSVAASDFRKTVPLTGTFYRWISYSSCGGFGKAKSRIKVPKKTSYAKLGSATQTYSICDYENIFYGDTYKLTDAAGEGKTDNFVSTLLGSFRNQNGKYKGTLNLDVSVAIGTE